MREVYYYVIYFSCNIYGLRNPPSASFPSLFFPAVARSRRGNLVFFAAQEEASVGSEYLLIWYAICSLTMFALKLSSVRSFSDSVSQGIENRNSLAMLGSLSLPAYLFLFIISRTPATKVRLRENREIGRLNFDEWGRRECEGVLGVEGNNYAGFGVFGVELSEYRTPSSVLRLICTPIFCARPICLFLKRGCKVNYFTG